MTTLLILACINVACWLLVVVLQTAQMRDAEQVRRLLDRYFETQKRLNDAIMDRMRLTDEKIGLLECLLKGKNVR